MKWIRAFLVAWMLLVLAVLSIDQEIVAPVVDSEISAGNCMVVADSSIGQYELWTEALDGELDR